MAPQLQWVIATGAGKPVGEDRKLIRSHVMRGKNRRRKTTGAASGRGRAGPSSCSKTDAKTNVNGSNTNGSTTTTIIKRDAAKTTKNTNNNTHDHDHDHERQALVLSPTSTKIGTGTGIEFLQFADAVDPSSAKHIFNYMTSLAESIYPAAYCLDRSQINADWISWLGKEPSSVHMAVATSRAHAELMRFRNSLKSVRRIGDGTPSTPGPNNTELSFEGVFSMATVASITRTLTTLQKTIRAREQPPTDGVLITVSTFVIISIMIRDLTTATKHVHGLMSLVEERGGIQALHWDIRRKVARADINHSLSTGHKPMIELAGIDWKTMCLGDGVVEEGQEIVPLSGLWDELRAICRLVNDAKLTGRKVSARVFNDSLTSTHLRLIALGHLPGGGANDERCVPPIGGHDRHRNRNHNHNQQQQPQQQEEEQEQEDRPWNLAPWFDPRSPLHDALRTAMLCFASSIWIDVHGTIPFVHRLSSDMRDVLEFVLQTTVVDDDAKLWMLLLASVTALRDDDWVADEARAHAGGRDWAAVSQMLKRDWLWADGIHDKPAKAVFEGPSSYNVVLLDAD